MRLGILMDDKLASSGSRATISVRTVRPEDLAVITAIYADAVLHGTASFEIEPPDEMAMRQRQQSLAGAGYPYIVAVQGETVVGYAYAGPYRARPAYRWSVENSVYVAPDMHRRGIGRALLAQLITDCEARDFRQMIAVIGDSAHQAPSIGLHRAAGFKFVGVLDGVGFKFGRWLDTAIMQRALGLGGTQSPSSVRDER
jgi:L-amino acid N-acyltransferase YncA